MKTTKDNILQEGLLEQYVLGELDATQEKSIEQLRMSDKDIANKLDSIERNFEKIGLENAIAPPAGVKVNLLTKVSNFSESVEEKPNSYKLWLGIAASFATFLLLGSLWLYSELNTVKEELDIVGNQNEALQKDLEGLTKSYNETNKWYTAISNPDTEQYILRGNIQLPDAKIVSYVNHTNKTVIINTQKLPELDKDHDYQMWADVDGEMIDMGVIAKDKSLMAMTYIDNAESLNITIEPAGGNDHPTVERLISNVYLD
ncbi:anti-sigma-K factor rskA [Winogradskyella wandonensis]|uniref:Anti-sigma-K factor rskA n=1 Tax=Winogradskyella wandonensis TaxID=1442586 RepID=A0A4R1KP45_9FLAO|nr:anti-sigma factor [Winogradskyella wandonensis]TCK66772.1 anti-sigma-K factor rskA [Winogradskyella wandonensis]